MALPGSPPTPGITARRSLLPATLLVVGALLLTACGGGSAPDSNVVLSTSSTTSAPDVIADPDDAAGSADSTTTTSPDDVGVETSEVVADTAPTTTAPQSSQGTALTDSARVSTLGLGPVFMGDTLEEVTEKIGVELLPEESGTESCRYYNAPGGPPGVTFLVAFGRIAVVEISDPSTITTRSGAGIGSTKQAIIDLFGDKIAVSPHPVGVGEYLTFVPTDEKDANLRIIFETNDQDVVVAYRTGQRPEVDLTDGCA